MRNFYLKIFLLLYFFCFSESVQQKIFAQDSSHIRISLLTCTPGEELYSIFGHSALRITDSSSVTDYVYNYGTFNFDDDGFYVKFIRGKLLYYISIAEFNDFKFEYQSSNRGITEQVLNFSADEKIHISHALIENLKEENKYYKYDFFLDNCTTRLRDMIVAAKHPHPLLTAVMPVNTTFLDNGGQHWSKLGIDILLGAPTDAVMTSAQQQFLPDNLMKALDSCSNVSVVKSASPLYDLATSPDHPGWFTPALFFSCLLLIFVVMGLSKERAAQMMLARMDGFLFFMTGLLGVLLIFMMTATDHSMTKNNYNILWALPTHLLISFFMNRHKKIIKNYFLIVSASLVLLLLCWFFLPQQMNVALIPFVLLLLYRSAMQYLKS